MKRTAYRSRDAYAQVNWEMVREVGGDITLAVVFDWIAWKADAAYDGVETDDGNTWYPTSLPALAATMNVSEKVVRRALDELVKRGHLAAEQLHLGGAYDRTKAYRPVWDDSTSNVVENHATDDQTATQPAEKASAPQGRSIRPTGQITSAPQGRSHLPHRADVPLFETSTEVTNKELKPIADENESPAPTIDDHFDQLWKIWPRKDAKKPALAKFKIAARRMPPAEIVAAARAWLAARPGVDPQHVPYASTWLNQERWSDELPATSAPPGRPMTQLERNLLDYETRYGGSDGRTTDTPALDSGVSDRQPSR